MYLQGQVWLSMTKYDSLANLEGYISIRTGGKQRATAQVRYVTRTQLSNISLSVVEIGRMRRKTEVGRLPGILGERVADSPALPCPFWLLAAALLLCTWDPSAKEWTQEAYMSKLWLRRNYLAHKTADTWAYERKITRKYPQSSCVHDICPRSKLPLL